MVLMNSLMANDTEHLFMGLLIMLIFSSIQSLKFFAYSLKIGFFLHYCLFPTTECWEFFIHSVLC